MLSKPFQDTAAGIDRGEQLQVATNRPPYGVGGEMRSLARCSVSLQSSGCGEAHHWFLSLAK